MHMSEEQVETPRERFSREQAERKEREAIFLQEHFRQATVYENLYGFWGKPREAGPGPTASNESPGSAADDDMKA
jgi:hypothetical protein